MAFHLLHKRCPECNRTITYRRPNSLRFLVKILPQLACHYCHPELLKDVCAACRYPFSAMPRQKGRGRVRKNMCFSCYVSWLRWTKRTALQKPETT